jgi:ribosomal protein S14
MVLLDDEAQVEARFSPFGESANVMQDRCTLCAEHTTGSKIVLGRPNVTPRQLGLCGISFRSVYRQC